MHVFINDREVGPLAATGATVGEVVEALGVHVDPQEIVTVLELDGVVYSAGEEERFATRAAAGVSRLVLRTQTPSAFAATTRAEIAAALTVLAAKAESAAALFRRGDDRAANALLAALTEELRLVLVLDQHLSTLDGGRPAAPVAAIRTLAPALLAAQERRAWGELTVLLEERLVVALRSADGTAPA